MKPEEFISDPSSIIPLLELIDQIARLEQPCEYGLPIHNENAVAAMQMAVLAWLSQTFETPSRAGPT
jgi:hypothetical protein